MFTDHIKSVSASNVEEDGGGLVSFLFDIGSSTDPAAFNLVREEFSKNGDVLEELTITTVYKGVTIESANNLELIVRAQSSEVSGSTAISSKVEAAEKRADKKTQKQIKDLEKQVEDLEAAVGKPNEDHAKAIAEKDARIAELEALLEEVTKPANPDPNQGGGAPNPESTDSGTSTKPVNNSDSGNNT